MQSDDTFAGPYDVPFGDHVVAKYKDFSGFSLVEKDLDATVFEFFYPFEFKVTRLVNFALLDDCERNQLVMRHRAFYSLIEETEEILHKAYEASEASDE